MLRDKRTCSSAFKHCLATFWFIPLQTPCQEPIYVKIMQKSSLCICFSESINTLTATGTTNRAQRVGSINKTQIPVTQIITSSFEGHLNLVFHASTLILSLKISKCREIFSTPDTSKNQAGQREHYPKVKASPFVGAAVQQ